MIHSGPTSQRYVSQRLRLRYVDWGNPAAPPPLVLLHGWRDHCRNWDWVAQQLRDEWHVIAPDLRGHGDSEWANDGQYLSSYVYDLLQLIDQLRLAPVNIIAHFLGGHIATRYAGLYPEKVQRLMVVVGLGKLPNSPFEGHPESVVDRLMTWMNEQRALSGRLSKRYKTVEEAFQRMHEENRHLTPEQAKHLTIQGVMRNEDGTYSWKFDNYVRAFQPNDIPYSELTHLWGRISCPVKLVYGKDSWAVDPITEGQISFFAMPPAVPSTGRGIGLHHDRTEDFIALARTFLETSV